MYGDLNLYIEASNQTKFGLMVAERPVVFCVNEKLHI